MTPGKLRGAAIALGLVALGLQQSADRVRRTAELQLMVVEERFVSRAELRAEQVAKLRGQAAEALALLEVPASSIGDAGVHLNNWVRWNEPQPPEAAERPKGLSRFARDTYRLAAIGGRVLSLEDWPSLYAWVPELGLRFEWMRELRGYSHWEAERADPIRNALARGAEEPSAFPVPDFEQLVLWGRLRLLGGIHEGMLADALLDTRALARLVFSSEIPGATEAAARILEAETEALRWAKAHRKTREKSLVPVPESSARALRMLAASAQPFLVPLSPASAIRTALGRRSFPGGCSLLNRSASTLFSDRALLRKRNPEAVAEIEARIGSWLGSGCRAPYFRRVWDTADYVPAALRAETFETPVQRSLAARGWVGIVKAFAGSEGPAALAPELRASESLRLAAAARSISAR